MVEFAIVASLLAMIVGGTFDFGMGWRATLNVNEGVRGGARVGSNLGPNQEADRTILTSLQSTMAASGMLNNVEKVVIFSAENTNGKPSAGCIAGTSGTCNMFTGNQFRAVTTTSTLDTNFCISSSTRKGWCPKQRDNVQLTADYIGVWVQVKYDYMFKVIGSSILIERSAVMRMEPL